MQPTPRSEQASRKAKVSPVHLEEAAALRKIWDSTSHAPQARFGELFDIGNQSAVGQFLRGAVPLSLKAARGFARGLNCSIADFSPRLAADAQTIVALMGNLPAHGAIAPHDVEVLIPRSQPRSGFQIENSDAPGELARAFVTIGASLAKLDTIGRRQAQPLFDALLATPENAAELAERYLATVGASRSTPAPTPSPQQAVAARGSKPSKPTKQGKTPGRAR